jgi:hypothetical protein
MWNPWSSFVGLISGTDSLDELQTKGDALDQTIAAENLADYRSGKYDENKYNQASADLQKALTGNVSQQVDDAFIQGAKEGLQNDATFFSKLSSAVNSLLKGAIKDALGAIPWQLWLIAAVVLFVYLGGLGILRRQIKNAS